MYNYHLLPTAMAKVTNTFNNLFDMCLLECLYVYVAFQTILCYNRLYLQWLQHENKRRFQTVKCNKVVDVINLSK